MTAAGTISAAKVLVVGAGVAGLQAIATAKRMGAIVHATDKNASKEQVESLGGKLTVEGAENLETEGDTLKKPQMISKKTGRFIKRDFKKNRRGNMYSFNTRKKSSNNN